MAAAWRHRSALCLSLIHIWVVDGIVKTTALLTFYCHAGDKIAHVDHVAELAEILAQMCIRDRQYPASEMIPVKVPVFALTLP